jgi:hypothetical protein
LDGCRLGDEGHRARGAWVGLQYVQHVPGEGVLDVEQAAYADPSRDRQRRLADPGYVTGAEGDRRQGTRRVAGMDAGLLDVLHDAAEVEVVAVV